MQASGTAIMMPLLFTTVFALVPAHMRGRVVGNISIVISVALALALGPTVSGIIADRRWLYITMMPFAIGALTLGTARIVNVGEQRAVRFDLLSVALSIPGFGGFVYGLSLIGERGAASSARPPLPRRRDHRDRALRLAACRPRRTARAAQAPRPTRRRSGRAPSSRRRQVTDGTPLPPSPAPTALRRGPARRRASGR